MSTLILDVIVFSVLLLLTVSLEQSAPSATFSRERPDGTGMVSRFLTIILVIFPGATLVRLRAAEKMLQGMGAKLVLYFRVLSGTPYLSEVVIYASITIFLFGSLAARRVAHQLVRRRVKAHSAKSASSEAL